MDGPLGIEYSPLSTAIVEENGELTPLWLREARDIARGFCGALFVALPLLYTLEMWERAVTTPTWILIFFVIAAYFANVGYNMFGGFKPEQSRQQAWWDAMIAMGLGALGSAVTLWMIGRYGVESSTATVAKLILLETVPTSFGASLAINQLGARQQDEGSGNRASDRLSSDQRKVLATILGATFFAFNVAPTLEPRNVAYTIDWWHLISVVFFSLFVSALMVFFANFIDREDADQGVLAPNWVETLFTYLVSLSVSALMLWFFGYFDAGISLPVAIAWVVTLGYVTTLGGSAGRLIL